MPTEISDEQIQFLEKHAQNMMEMMDMSGAPPGFEDDMTTFMQIISELKQKASGSDQQEMSAPA